MSGAVVPHGRKSVDQKVLEVVRAAEQLVKPVVLSANALSTDDVSEGGSIREQKTTTIIMTKHVVEPQTSTVR